MSQLDAEFLAADILNPGADPLEAATVPKARALRRHAARRFARLRQRQRADEILADLPAPGETLHVISDATFDFWTWVPVLADRLAHVDRLYCSTWTLNRETALDLFAIMDEGQIENVAFLTGLYFKRREAAVYHLLLDGLRKRGGRYRALPNHCKLLLIAAGETRLVIEGSANLTGNPRAEQYALTHDAALYDFCRGWFEELLEKIPPPESARPAAAASERLGYSQRRAGLGVLAARRDKASRRRALGWKMATFEDEDITRAMARAVADVIRQAQPTTPPGTVVTCPPQGASWPGHYFAHVLAHTVAGDLGLPFKPGLITRPDLKRYHGPHDALAQPPFSAAEPGPAVVVVDDLITSGATMLRALAACRDSGAAAWGYAFSGC